MSDSVFDQNLAKHFGGAINIRWHGAQQIPDKLDIYIHHVNFINNAVKFNSKGSGAALQVTVTNYGLHSDFCCSISVTMRNVTYVNNTSDGDGGAVSLILPSSNSNILIIECQFINNKCGRYSRGGAIHFAHNPNPNMGDNQETFPNAKSSFSGNKRNPNGIVMSNAHIRHSKFTDNIGGQGGSIYAENSLPIVAKLLITNSTFFCCTSVKDRKYPKNGTPVISLVATEMNCVYFEQNRDNEATACPIPSVVLDNLGGPHLVDNTEFVCVEGKITRAMEGMENYVNGSVVSNKGYAPLDYILLYRSWCTFPPYAVGNGSFKIYTVSQFNEDGVTYGCNTRNYEDKYCYRFNHYTENISPCNPCPFGADCSKNFQVVPRPNYWGYKHNGLLYFQNCPLDYCCNDIDVSCDSINKCAFHRRSRLCGECEPGYTESLMSRTCIPDERCKDWWIWPTAVLLATIYLFWYMYKGDIFPALERLILKIYGRFRRKKKIYGTENNTLSTFSSTVENNTGNSAVELETQTAALTSSENVTALESVDRGYFDILVYFINIISLLSVKVEFQTSERTDSFLYNLEKYLTRYLDADMQQIANVTACPFPGIDAFTKSLARPGFVLIIILIWIVLQSLALLFTVSEKTNFKAFRMKLIEGYVETMKYSYSGLAGSTFIFLTCVTIGDERYWKYNAEHRCFSEWQFRVIIFAFMYTVPFAVTTMFGIKLLQKGEIGYKHFMLAIALTLPFLVVWLIYFVLVQGMIKKTNGTIFNQFTKALKQSDRIPQQNVSEQAQIILDAFQGPYKGKNTYWKSVIEIRKLFFNSFFLISNNIYRLVICTVAAIAVSFQHRLVKPFKYENSNNIESLSLSLLRMACVTNSIRTGVTEFGVLIQPNTPTEQLLMLMNRLDRIMIVSLLTYIVTSELYITINKLNNK